VDPFDPSRAELPTRVVRLDDVVDLLEVTHAPEEIERYREEMLDGGRFPPIAVVCLAGRYFVADGHKRLAAYKALDRPDILVEVWTTRRLMRDLRRQQWVSIRKAGLIVWWSFTNPAGAAALARSFWQHWRRVGTSLAAKWRNNP
jgi:hypothetical protein